MSGCGRCAQDHLDWRGRPGCTSHVRYSGPGVELPDGPRPCRKPRRPGLTVCVTHGGSAPRAVAAAKRKVTEQKAAAIMVRFGGPIDTSPTEALLDSVRWVAGYVAFLREQVERITEEADTVDDLVWGKTKEVEGDVVVGDGSSAALERANTRTHEAEPNAWLPLLGTWQDRLTKLCAEAIRAGIEERRVRLAEQQGALVADTFRAIAAGILQALRAAGLTADLEQVFSNALAIEAPRHLRLLIGGAA